eukprot:15358464-Alexandrium_andersonii.AAC.1
MMFAQYVRETPDGIGAKITNLRLAKQRFESTQKPLGRSVLWIDAVVLCAIQIWNTRRCKPESLKALAFLEVVNEEAIIQMGMLADCGDECILLTRFLDAEGFDAAHLAEECNTLLRRLNILFVQGKCLESGYTRFAIDSLMRVKVLPCRDGSTRTLGSVDGPAADVIRACLKRMVCFTHLARDTLKYEFPDFDALNGFAIFSLVAVRA